MSKYILVDAGGTKTKAVLYDEEQKLLNSFTGLSGSFAVKGEDALCEIEKCIEKVYEKNIKAISIGASGIGACSYLDLFKKRLKDKFNVPVLVVNDAYIALYSVLKDKHETGVMILSGTGSSTLIKGKDGLFLTGGWGHLLTEEGSAYKISIDALKMAINDYEAGKEKSPLTKKVLLELKIKDIENIKSFVYTHRKDEIAQGAIAVREAANNLDKDALVIINKAAEELTKTVTNGIKKAKLTHIFLGFRGGYIVRDKVLQSKIINLLSDAGLEVETELSDNMLSEFDLDPVMGAYYLLKNEGY